MDTASTQKKEPVNAQSLHLNHYVTRILANDGGLGWRISQWAQSGRFERVRVAELRGRFPCASAEQSGERLRPGAPEGSGDPRDPVRLGGSTCQQDRSEGGVRGGARECAPTSAAC